MCTECLWKGLRNIAEGVIINQARETRKKKKNKPKQKTLAPNDIVKKKSVQQQRGRRMRHHYTVSRKQGKRDYELTKRMGKGKETL